MRIMRRLADSVTERFVPRATAQACGSGCTWGGSCGSGGVRRCCWVGCNYTCGCVS